jgi:hypothetical protein
MSILKRYKVDSHAYGYCEACGAYFDYWRNKETDFLCPWACGNMLRQLTPEEMAKALADCEQNECFQGHYKDPTPFKPIPKLNLTAPV